MKKSKIICSLVVSAIACSAVFSGCSLVSTNNRADMEQVIAHVDIRNSENFESQLESYKDAVISTDIVKRDLVAYYLNVGSSFSNTNASSSTILSTLVNSLVNTAVLTQYATLSLLKEKAETENLTAEKVVSEFTDSGKTEAEKYEYLLTDDEINVAKYSLYSAINTAIDNQETKVIASEDETSASGTETRTTPGNVDTELEDFYPATAEGQLDYNVYTGYEGYLLSDSGDYQNDKLDNTTKYTRIEAYNMFVNNLKSSYLVDRDTEDLSDVLNLEYIKQEYVSQLKSAVINKYYDLYEEQLEGKILPENGSPDYSYLQNKYNEMLSQQTANYSTASAFETAMGSMSDTSFILYSPTTEEDTKKDQNGNYGTFGFVYNILLPFSDRQSVQLSEAGARYEATSNEYFIARNEILRDIRTTDQRSAWFNGTNEYAFEATDLEYYGKDAGRNYLFFENNLNKNDRYESLKNYDGRYSYNGTAVKNTDGSYTLVPEKLSIDDMLNEFSAYVDYVLGGQRVTTQVSSAYYDTTDFYKEDSNKEVDYSKLVYARGSVDIGTVNRSDLFNKDSDMYKAMSAVNELQYAYTTDTSVLSQYVGYTVSAYSTSYIKEFEYAAHEAINKGAGNFIVCAGDYGWHLIYVTYTFDTAGEEVYNVDWSRIKTEGTFENLFFEYVKSSDLTNASGSLQTTLIQQYTGEDAVTKYESRYTDLLDYLG